MMMSKVVDDADNGTCDIATMDNNNGSALSIYHPTSGYAGQDKCTYEMCIVDDDGESGGAINAATKECSELTIARRKWRRKWCLEKKNMMYLDMKR